MILTIKSLLYQLYDCSCLIKEYSNLEVLSENYTLNSNILLLACIEEKYLMNKLELTINKYFNLKKGLVIRRTWEVKYDTGVGGLNYHYLFKKPKGINKTSEEFINLQACFNEVKKETHDIDNYTFEIGLGGVTDGLDKLFRLQNRHPKFYTDTWLKENNIKIKI